MAEGRNEAQEQNDAGEERFEGQDIRELRTYFEGEFRALKRQVSPYELINDRANRRWTEWRVCFTRYSISSKVGAGHSTHLRGDQYTITLANDHKTMIATTPMMMTISIIRPGLVFVDLLRLMLGRYLYLIIWTLLVRDAILLDREMLLLQLIQPRSISSL